MVCDRFFFFFFLLSSDTLLKCKALFLPCLFYYFFVRGTCTLYVITSRMYSGPRQQNYYFDDLSCLEGLLYSSLQNVAFDFKLAEALPIIIAVPAIETICTLHAKLLL